MVPPAGRRSRAYVRSRQQQQQQQQPGSGTGGVGNVISNVLKKRNGISRSAPRLLCTLEPGDRGGVCVCSWCRLYCSLNQSVYLKCGLTIEIVTEHSWIITSIH